VVIQQLGDRVCVQGSGEVVALPLVASHGGDRGALLGLLDPFGHGLQAQAVPELGDSAGHRRCLGAVGDAVDERLVDLEDVDWEPLQVAQG
jgi:hypothetical protein